MGNVLIAAYLIIVLALIAVILLQRSEGGGLGIGSSSGGLISVRGSANLLTRTTAILATLFFATAIGLTIFTEIDRGTQGILDSATDAIGTGGTTAGAPPTNALDALNAMSGVGTDAGLPVPTTSPGATTTTTAPTTAPAATTTTSDPGLALPAAPTTTTTAPAN